MDAAPPRWTYSFSYYHYLRSALAQRTFYTYAQSGPSPLCNMRRRNRLYAEFRLLPSGETPDRRRPESERSALRERLGAARDQLTDLDPDILDAAVAHWLSAGSDPDQYVWIDTDDLLYGRGLRHKVNGQGTNANAIGRGYAPSQRADANRALCRLLLLWGDVKVIHPHDRDPFVEDGPALEVESASWSEAPLAYATGAGGDDIRKRHRFRLRPGPIFRRFPLFQRMYQPLAIHKYNYHQRWWEKRLGRYLSWQWRVNKSESEVPALTKSISSLLQATLLAPTDGRHGRREGAEVRSYGDREERKEERRSAGRRNKKPAPPARVRTRLEKALKQLSADDVIGRWSYGSGWDPSWSRKSNWADLWQRADVEIVPGSEVAAAYAEDPPDASDEPGGAARPTSSSAEESP